GQPVHREDLLFDLALVIGHSSVCINLDDIEVWDDGDEPFAENVAVEDIAQAGLGVRRETEDVPLPFRGHVVAQARAARRLAESAFPGEDHDPFVAFRLEIGGQAHGLPQKTWSVKSRSRNTRCFQLLMLGTAYGRILRE